MLIALHSLLPADGTAPEWVHLVPAGVIRTVDGRGPYRLRDADPVITASMAGGKLPIDENHATDLAAPKGGPSPAVAWIVEMQARDDGIWGRVEWNPSGVKLLAEHAYKGISPVFDATKDDGTVVRVQRAALTNTPNLLDLHTLQHQEPGMDLITQLRQALGLPETADDAAVLAAIKGDHTAVATHAANIAAIATAAGVQATDSKGLVTALQAQRQTVTEATTLQAEVTTLRNSLTTLTNERAKEKATTFVDAQVAAGKPISTAMREHYITRHMADPAAVETELAAMISLHTGGVGNRAVIDAALHAAADEDGLTQAERTMCEKMGFDPAEFAKAKKDPAKHAREKAAAKKGSK